MSEQADDHFIARPIQDGDLERYEEWAAAGAQHILAGHVNWPMIVRSLAAEVRRLKSVANAP